MGTPTALWDEIGGTRDERGCPAQLVSAIDVRLDRAAKTTKISLLIEDPPAEWKGRNGLEKGRDYSDCSRAVHGNPTSIVYWDTAGVPASREDTRWIY